jgi:hypothetical protein
MKKIVVFLLMVLMSATLYAKDHGNYVQTNQGTFFFKKVKIGITGCVIGIKENGERVKFQKSEILTFAKGGLQYEKRPVYKENKPTGEEGFMALVCYRNGLKLFKYEYMSSNTQTQSRRYYVFKGDKFVVELDDRNKPTLTAFFNAK